ncbi:MAG TPA: DUF362 domain-containing protein [Polyangia bacterium]|jgi:Uncharacterized conserved protein|nr:DUF362 domain-containing protein [Polyangia bacterium]
MSNEERPGPYEPAPAPRVRQDNQTTAQAANAGTDRRGALRVGVTAAMAVGSVALGLALHDRGANKKTRALPTIKDHRADKPAGATDMAIVRGPDPAANVRRAIEALGGMGRFVRRGERVVIKPNIGWNRLPEQAANTNPDVVAEVVRLVLAAGASKVWLTDASVNTPEQCFARSGIEKAAKAAGATVIRPDASAFREVNVSGKLLRTGDVLFPIVEADRVINIPVVKQHGLSLASMALKNWYGVLGGQRVKLHQNIHLSIIDLAAMVKPTLTVLDATRILLANGPTGGSLSDVKQLDTIAAGTDEVALDAFGATLLGLNPNDVGFIVEGMKAGLGTPRWQSLKTVELGG